MAKTAAYGQSLLEGTPWKRILIFSLPIMMGNVVQQLYHTADTMIVGNFESEAALSAVGTCTFLVNLYLALGMGFSNGAGVLAAQMYGGGRHEELRKFAKSAISMLLALSVVVTVVGFFASHWLLETVILVPEELMEMAWCYLRIYTAGICVQFAYNIVAALLRAVGDSKTSLYFLLISSVVNIVLDILFIRYFRWGVAGAAWATVISQVACCAAAFGYLNKNYPDLRFGLKDFKLNADHNRTIFRTGWPIAWQQIMGACGFMGVQRLVNGYGAAMTASYTVAGRIDNYMFAVLGALMNAMATFNGQNWGNGDEKRVIKGTRQGVILAIIITFGMSTFVALFARPIIGLFGIEGQSFAYCLQHTMMNAYTYPLFALFYPLHGLFQGTGKTKVTAVVSTTALGLRVVYAYLVSFTPLTFQCVWLCQPLAWITTDIAVYIYILSGRWKKGLVPPKPKTEPAEA